MIGNNKICIYLILSTVIIIMCMCRTPEKTVQILCREDKFEEVLNRVDKRDFRVRHAIASCLSSKNSVDVIPYMLRFLAALQHTTHNQRNYVMVLEQLVNISNHNNAFDTEIKAFLRNELTCEDNSWFRKRVVLKHIDRFFSTNDEDVLSIIESLVEQSNDNQFKLTAAESLAKIGDYRYEQIVEQLMFSDYFADQREALRVIGFFNDVKHIPALVRFVEDKDHIKRNNAIASLKMIAGDNYQSLISENVTSRIVSGNIELVDASTIILQEEYDRAIDRGLQLINLYSTYLNLLGDVSEPLNDRELYKNALIDLFSNPEVYVLNDLDPEQKTSKHLRVEMYANNVILWYLNSGLNTQMQIIDTGEVTHLRDNKYYLDIHAKKSLQGLYMNRIMNTRSVSLVFRIGFERHGRTFSKYKIEGVTEG